MGTLRIFLCAALLAASAACGSDTVDPLSVIEDKIIEPMGWDPAGTRVYVTDQPLQPGQTVGPAMGAAITIDEPTWFAWVDLSPDEYFSHDTRFIYMDEDGSNVRMEDHQWFPIIDERAFVPDTPDWGDDTPPSFAAIERVLQPSTSMVTSQAIECGYEARAIVLQGFPGKNGWLDRSADRVIEALRARPYGAVYDLRFEAQPDNIARKELLFSTLSSINIDDVQQLDIFYLGHGAAGVWLLGGDDDGWTPQIAIEDLVSRFIVGRPEAVNIVVDSCHSAQFADQLDAKTSPALDNTEVRVLASASRSQKAIYSAGGSAYTEALMNILESQPTDTVFDFGAVNVAPISYQKRTPAGLVDAMQTPENHVAPPDAPILALAGESGECQVAGVLSADPATWLDNYERKVTIRGRGFGDSPGRVLLHTWDWSTQDGDRFPLDAAADLEVVDWADDYAVVYVPMRARGFPSDPEGIDRVLGPGNQWETDTWYQRQTGRYVIRIETADGALSAEYREAPPAFYAPQFLHIWPQVATLAWTPDYTTMASVEWNEMWHLITPESASLGRPTVLVSDMRLMSERSSLQFGGPLSTPAFATINADMPHVTGAEANGLGGWIYELEAGLRDLATAYDQRNPQYTYWGFRQRMDEGWAETPTWTYTLIYD